MNSNQITRERFIATHGYDQTEYNTKIEVILMESDCPDDGGNWALYCCHTDGVGVLQDTNKRRLALEKKNTWWCPYCQKNEDFLNLAEGE